MTQKNYCIELSDIWMGIIKSALFTKTHLPKVHEFLLVVEEKCDCDVINYNNFFEIYEKHFSSTKLGGHAIDYTKAKEQLKNYLRERKFLF